MSSHNINVLSDVVQVGDIVAITDRKKKSHFRLVRLLKIIDGERAIAHAMQRVRPSEYLPVTGWLQYAASWELGMSWVS